MHIIQYKVGDRNEYQCYNSITIIFLIVAERDQKTKKGKRKTQTVSQTKNY